jgi:hypothetical protein
MKKTVINAEAELDLNRSFDAFFTEIVNKRTKEIVVSGLPSYIKEGDEFVEYIEKTINNTFVSMIEGILGEKLGLVKNGRAYKLQNESKHPLAAIINTIFRDETEKLVKEKTRSVMSDMLSEVATSIKEDKEFLKEIREMVSDHIKQEIVNSINSQLNEKTKETVATTMKELYKKI